MWLEVGTTTNDLQVVANYFLDCVKQMRGTARVVFCYGIIIII